MIEKAMTVPAGTVQQCDFCIVGGGPAGIAIGNELAGSSKKVFLLESGGWRENGESRDLLRGYVWPVGSHEPPEESRRRQFGGASVAWGGRCVRLDPIDFERRPWVPYSGWPIAEKDLSMYLARANELCEAGRPIYDAAQAFPDRQYEMIANFDDADVVSSALERWGPPTNFAKRYGPLLNNAANVVVLLHATVVHLQLDQASRKVSMVNVAVNDSHRFSIRTKHIVLACGGLENARLLLASNDVVLSGIGNESDKVGRFYMSHLTGINSWATLCDPTQGFVYDLERDGDVYVRRRFWITEQAQRREGIGNAIAYFSSPYSSLSMYDNALSSVLYLAKFARSLKRIPAFNRIDHIHQNRSALLTHLKIVSSKVRSLAPQIIQVVKQRYFVKRRLPILLPRKEDLNNRFELYYQTEHAPNPESRVVLHSDRDSLGMPRLEVRISFTDLDVKTVLQLHRLIKERLRQSATGELLYKEDALEEAVRCHLRSFHSAAHHIGTTRMSSDPIDGVVDKNCRVHGTENVFIAGCSVFPTSGHANPTLPLIALAFRLADHLKAL
jgi:choline dehydrogenase-like flavoprotein